MSDVCIGISVVTSIYNKSVYLDDYFKSLMNQSFKNFEVICVEDCSTDDSMEHLNRLVFNKPQFTVIKNEVNSGLSVSRNKAINMCKGKYVCFLDADDCFRPDAFEKLWNVAEKYELDGVLFSASEYSENLKKNLRSIQYKASYPICDGRTIISLLHKNNEYSSACGFQLWNVQYLKNINASFYPGIVYEDTLFTLKTLLKAKKVTAIPDNIYIYRKCQDSISHSLGIKQLKSCLIIYEALRNFEKQYIHDELVYFEIHERLLLFEKRIQHIICTEQDKIKDLVLDENNSKILKPFLETISFPYIREFSDEEKENIKKASDVYVFGDGIIAEEAMALLKKENIRIKAIIVSNLSSNIWKGYSVISIDDFCDRGMVIISVTPKWRKSIEDKLKENGNETIFITK